MMLDWLLEAVGGSETPAPAAKPAKAAATPAVTKEISKLEAENEELEKKVAKLRALSDAVQVIKTFKVAAEQPKPKAKAKAKGKGKAKAKAEAKEGGEPSS